MTYSQFQQPPSPPPYHARPYQSARARARVVIGLLIAGAVICLVTIPWHFLEMYSRPFNDEETISDNPLGFLSIVLAVALGLAAIVVYFATVVVFLMWLYRVSNNVAAFGQRTQHSSGWAVGSFFVPIMNLFVPYQAVKDIWSKSEPTGADATAYSFSPPGFFPAWWGFWLAGNIASNIYFRMTWADTPVEGAAIVGILSEVLSLSAAVFAIQVVREIDRRQEERARTLQQTGFSSPPPPPVFNAGERPNAAETSNLSGSNYRTNLQG